MNSINKPSLERLTFWFSMYQTFFSSLWIVQFKVFHFKHHFLRWHEGVKMHIKYYDLVLSHFEGSSMYIAYPLLLFLYHVQSLQTETGMCCQFGYWLILCQQIKQKKVNWHMCLYFAALIHTLVVGNMSQLFQSQDMRIDLVLLFLPVVLFLSYL